MHEQIQMTAEANSAHKFDTCHGRTKYLLKFDVFTFLNYYFSYLP